MLTRRPLSVSHALHMLSSCVLCLAPPAADLLEAPGRSVCTRRACCFCSRMSRTFAVSVELLPRSWRAVTFPRLLHVLSCSTWLIIRCYCFSFGGLCDLCVRDRLAASVCDSRIYYLVILLILLLSFFLRVGAPSFSLGGFMSSCSKVLDVAHCSLLHRRLRACILASLALILFHPPSCASSGCYSYYFY